MVTGSEVRMKETGKAEKVRKEGGILAVRKKEMDST